jgi:hypothetical protein
MLPMNAATFEKSLSCKVAETFLSSNTVKPSFNQNDSQFSQVTSLPVQE